MTQNNLGTALRALGERESGTARLEAAVAAFRAALQERTRDRVPLDWAMTQNNLGHALRALGARESGTARLEEAIVAWEANLTVTASAWLAVWVQRVHDQIAEAQAEITRRRR
jgi:tetratricopeptide (TPR) repeat protein